MEELIQQIASSLGLTATSSALLVGAIGGFLLRSAFKSRSDGEPFNPPSVELQRSMVPPISGGMHQAQANALELTSQQIAEVKELLRQGNKIEAIKHFRQITGTGLAEAKSAVEALER